MGAVSGQFFITASIRNYGAVYFATVMTVQQILSVIVSSLFNGNQINYTQVVSCAVVFGSLMTKSFISSYRQIPPQANAQEQTSDDTNPTHGSNVAVVVDGGEQQRR
eukprot:Plantae.Rhodophyta-Purpureofilum_apyrenoidigerum.ctg42065.p2 GENE.Plantae.Rhodophyta-Purpureofilum_apyrenoidigerum.ctg42065~~Plantae.Rhodophyta-Purpureofilum_apyrenoidigerum.ctg42065.p2  ORF type:complete len:115 (+),score=17.24 Plantae.Rhodophyta-Purpureofilum_apyrenoidigerum.ctg42065:27-347(+)